LQARLTLQIDGVERIFRLDDEVPCRIGRSPQNTIVLQSDGVSRNHAIVQSNESGGYCVFDLSSRNGTIVNGQHIAAPAQLRDGDVLKVGNFELTFAYEAAAEVETAPAARVSPELSETTAWVAAKEITVLVIDIRDFTGWSRRLGETRIAEVIGTFNREAGAILQTVGTWGLKYIGDAIMAVWIHDGKHPSQSVLRTVFEAAVRVRALADGLQRRFNLPDPILIGAGVNTGVASIGNLGGGAGSDHTALGDVVNKAFRLESSTRHTSGEIAFGEEVRTVLGDSNPLFEVAQHHQLRLKGYTGLADVYMVPIDRVSALLG
jgi:adenylate cyclase